MDKEELLAIQNLVGTIEYIHKHFAQKLSVEDLAVTANMSLSHFPGPLSRKPVNHRLNI